MVLDIIVDERLGIGPVDPSWMNGMDLGESFSFVRETPLSFTGWTQSSPRYPST